MEGQELWDGGAGDEIGEHPPEGLEVTRCSWGRGLEAARPLCGDRLALLQSPTLAPLCPQRVRAGSALWSLLTPQQERVVEGYRCEGTVPHVTPCPHRWSGRSPS